MGHKDIQTTMDVYAEATEQKKQESFERLAAKLDIFLIVEEALWWGAQNDSKIIEWQQIDNKRREIKA